MSATKITMRYHNSEFCAVHELVWWFGKQFLSKTLFYWVSKTVFIDRRLLCASRDGDGQNLVQSRQPGSRLKTPGLPIWVRYLKCRFSRKFLINCFSVFNRSPRVWAITESFSTLIASFCETTMQRNVSVGFLICYRFYFPRLFIDLFGRTSSLHLCGVLRVHGEWFGLEWLARFMNLLSQTVDNRGQDDGDAGGGDFY